MSGGWLQFLFTLLLVGAVVDAAESQLPLGKVQLQEHRFPAARMCIQLCRPAGPDLFTFCGFK